MLKEAYDDVAIAILDVFEWHKSLKEGSEKIEKEWKTTTVRTPFDEQNQRKCVASEKFIEQ